MYNEKLKQAYTKADYISKGKYKRVERKPWGQLRGEVGYCAKLLSKETIPRHFCMPITQAAKEPDLRLTPSTEKVLGARGWEAPTEICLLQGRRR